MAIIKSSLLNKRHIPDLFSYSKKNHASLYLNMPVQFYKAHHILNFHWPTKRKRGSKDGFTLDNWGGGRFPEAGSGGGGCNKNPLCPASYALMGMPHGVWRDMIKNSPEARKVVFPRQKM